MKVETKTVKLSKIKLNPDNPRKINKQDMDKLVKSLTDFPDMLKIREIVVDETMVVLGGNMRLQALRKVKAKDCTAKIVTGLSDTQKREFVIKDNSSFGEWDMDLLSGWDDLPLADFGIDLPEDWKSESEEKEPSELATKPFGDERDTMSMQDLLNSVDLVKVSFSGGKDSVGMAIYLHMHFEIPKEKMLLEHYYNPFEWEDMSKYCKYFSKTFGIELKEYGNEPPDDEKEKVKIYGKRNADNFMIDKIKSHGLPSVYQKWCFERYKQRVFTYVARRYKKINYIQAVGMRAAESSRRAKLEDRGITRDIQPFCYPIHGLSDEETFGLAIKNNIKLHHAYKFFSRTGCPACPMSPAEDFAILRKEYPKVWDKALRLYLLSLECDYYRQTEDNRPKVDFERIMGVSIVKKSRRKEWKPPKGLTFWRGED